MGLGLLTERFPNHAQTNHIRQDSSWRMIGLSQRSLPENTQHLQETDIYAPCGIRTCNPTERGPQTHALDRAATGIGRHKKWDINWETTVLSYTYKIARPTYLPCSSRSRNLIQPVVSVAMTHRVICVKRILNWAPANLLQMVKPIGNRLRICIL